MQWFSVKEVVYFVRVCESHASGAWKEITGMGKSFSPFMHHFNSIPSFRISLGSLILRRPRLFAEGTTNNDLGRLRIRLITWLLRMIAASCKLCSWIVPRVKSPLLPSCNGAGLDLEMGPFNYPYKEVLPTSWFACTPTSICPVHDLSCFACTEVILPTYLPYINESFWSCLKVRILWYFAHINKVTKANYHTYK